MVYRVLEVYVSRLLAFLRILVYLLKIIQLWALLMKVEQMHTHNWDKADDPATTDEGTVTDRSRQVPDPRDDEMTLLAPERRKLCCICPENDGEWLCVRVNLRDCLLYHPLQAYMS